jgi:hypothetical protein
LTPEDQSSGQIDEENIANEVERLEGLPNDTEDDFEAKFFSTDQIFLRRNHLKKSLWCSDNNLEFQTWYVNLITTRSASRYRAEEVAGEVLICLEFPKHEA